MSIPYPHRLASHNPEVAHTIVADGIRTNYHDVGSGDPVLLIHG